VARWAHESGAPDAALALARAAAYAVSVATAQGHVCIDVASLDEAAGLADPRAALIASHVAAAPDDNTASPLVVDADGRVYLRRYFEYERRLAQRLVALQRAPSRAVDAATSALLRAAFPHKDAEGQRLAAALALTRPLALISGGPGTGKTTTIVHVLACLIAQDPDVRIKLAAPTGKAAARMQQAIRERAATLPDGQRTRLPTEAFTVHRLLGARPGEPRFRHDAQHPLAIDVLVVDEASMLDLALAAKLVDAVPPGARIVLCGDKDQLAAVEAGAVFAELTKAQAWSSGRYCGARRRHRHRERHDWRARREAGIGAGRQRAVAAREFPLLRRLRDWTRGRRDQRRRRRSAARHVARRHRTLDR
jgi:exodeoxyribonuclease V alpha subunit